MKMSMVPFPWWASVSKMRMRFFPSRSSAAAATATSLNMQNPSPYSGPAWWSPPKPAASPVRAASLAAATEEPTMSRAASIEPGRSCVSIERYPRLFSREVTRSI